MQQAAANNNSDDNEERIGGVGGDLMMGMGVASSPHSDRTKHDTIDDSDQNYDLGNNIENLKHWEQLKDLTTKFVPETAQPSLRAKQIRARMENSRLRTPTHLPSDAFKTDFHNKGHDYRELGLAFKSVPRAHKDQVDRRQETTGPGLTAHRYDPRYTVVQSKIANDITFSKLKNDRCSFLFEGYVDPKSIKEATSAGKSALIDQMPVCSKGDQSGCFKSIGRV